MRILVAGERCNVTGEYFESGSKSEYKIVIGYRKFTGELCVVNGEFSDLRCRMNTLIKEIDDLLEQLRSKTNEVNQLSDVVKTLKIQNETYQSQLQKFPHTTEKTTCSYKFLKKNPKQFFYLTGLCVEDFDCLFACVEPYISAMYPNCETHQQRKLTKRTELMCFMTICRHTLHLGITGYMSGTSVSTQSRIFTAWAVFLSTLFNQLDLSPCPRRGSFSSTSGILCIWLPGHSVARRLHRELDCFTRKL